MTLLDLVLRGGTVVDGTGDPAVVADVGVQSGRIVDVGSAVEPGRREIDVTGLVVAPGFIDVHTHYDAQICWDGTLSPSPLHGVTSVFSGNCGFTLAPIAEQDKDYMLAMLARVEGMPLDALELGVGCEWTTTGQYLDRFDGNTTPNVGFMVGHSALRRNVMHDEATERPATSEEIARMCELLDLGLAAGGMGFSSTWSPTHNDHRGIPVPSRAATRDELLALCAVVARHEGTALEFIPTLGEFDEQTMDIMASMSRVAERTLNWNMLLIYPGNEDLAENQLSASDYAGAHGGKVTALTLPEPGKIRLNFQAGMVFDTIPGWGDFFRLSEAERLSVLADGDRRRTLGELAQAAPTNIREYARWGRYRLETFAPEAVRFNRKTVDEVAIELGVDAWDAVCTVLLMDELRTGFFMPPRGDDDAIWQRRLSAWRDPRTVVGASDAGAHLDMIDTYSYTTRLLEVAVKQRGLLSIEEAVKLLTAEPAAMYGMVDRGRILEGMAADLVVMDIDRISAGEPVTRHDLPGGSARLTSDPEGMELVFVNGVEVVADNKFNTERPGRMLRSGVDTSTVRPGPIHSTARH
jgi:N-acyl-D-aspartate/D-glutamate deacylase